MDLADFGTPSFGCYGTMRAFTAGAAGHGGRVASTGAAAGPS
jgi:hypothetical protein